MHWHRLAFNEQANVRGNVIRCPNTSAYRGYEFTHPERLIQLGNCGTLIVVFHDDWKFRLRKRNEVVELTVPEFIAAFRNETLEVLSNHDPRAPFLKVIEPEPLVPIAPAILTDLVQ